MEVRNVHQRTFGSHEPVGALIDSLASDMDRLWPLEAWPRMTFDRALGVGAVGGHGPIRYFVEAYQPGQSVRFRFTGPTGFRGWHGYDVIPAERGGLILRHTLAMNATGLAILSWPLVFRAMHDALIEDSLAKGEASMGHAPSVRLWTLWVKFLRWVFSGGRAGPQVTPGQRRGKKRTLGA